MLAVWRSRSVSLLPSSSICHAAAGSRALWSQLSAQLQIISLSLSANSRHAAVNITSLPASRFTQSLTGVCCELNDGLHQLYGKSGCSDGDNSLIWLPSLCRAQWMTENCKYHFVWLLFLEIEVSIFPGDMYNPPCSMLLITWLENKWPEVVVIMRSCASLSGWN